MGARAEPRSEVIRLGALGRYCGAAAVGPTRLRLCRYLGVVNANGDGARGVVDATLRIFPRLPAATPQYSLKGIKKWFPYHGNYSMIKNHNLATHVWLDGQGGDEHVV
jgi:hypothetical protein